MATSGLDALEYAVALFLVMPERTVVKLGEFRSGYFSCGVIGLFEQIFQHAKLNRPWLVGVEPIKLVSDLIKGRIIHPSNMALGFWD